MFNPFDVPKREVGPASLHELLEEAKVDIDVTKYPLKRWITSALTLLEQAKQYEKEGDLENAFVAYKKSSSITLDVIPKHPNLNTSDILYTQLMQQTLATASKVSNLSFQIEERYKKYQAAQLVSSIASFDPFGSSRTVDVSLGNFGMDPKLQQQPPQKPLNSVTVSAPGNPFLTPSNSGPASLNSSPSLAPKSLQSLLTTPNATPNGHSHSFLTATTNHHNPFKQPAVANGTDLGLTRSHSTNPAFPTSSSPSPQPFSTSSTSSVTSPHNPFRTNTPPPASHSPQPNHFNPFLTDMTRTNSLPAQRPPPAVRNQGPPPGLRNLGNTCYMNSTLQCLALTMPLSSFFVNGYWMKYVNRTNPRGKGGRIAWEFAKLMKEMWEGGGEDGVVVPKEFKKSIGEMSAQFQGSGQQDSSEFLTCVLDAIHEDLNVAPEANLPKLAVEDETDEFLPEDALQKKVWGAYIQKDYSIVVDLFQGQLKSTLQCMSCHKTSMTFHPFMYLSVPVPNSATPIDITACIQSFIQSEHMQGENAWRCPRCKTRRNAMKFTSVSRFPSILIIHLKRFEHAGALGGNGGKVETDVRFPIMGLDLGFCGSGTVAKAYGGIVKEEKNVYNLYGVLNHSGTLSSGHYTAKMRHGGKWYMFDDAIVKGCSQESVQKRKLPESFEDEEVERDFEPSDGGLI
ncbi:ubiquitin-specific protease doa4, partial [Phlyctochytrium planicorne]